MQAPPQSSTNIESNQPNDAAAPNPVREEGASADPAAGDDYIDVDLFQGAQNVTAKRLYAHATAEMQQYLSEAFRARSKGKKMPLATPRRARLKPNTEYGYVEVFPRNSTQPPRLLQVLERLLREGMWEAVLEASSSPALTGRHKDIAANLRLLVHSAVFEEFIGGFESYAPLLREIKDELDGVLDDAVRCARENTELKKQLSDAEGAKEKVVEDAYIQAAAAAAQFRRDMHKHLIAMEERILLAEERLANAQGECRETSQELAVVKEDVKKLLESNERLKGVLRAEEDWPKKESRTALRSMMIGNVTQEV